MKLFGQEMTENQIRKIMDKAEPSELLSMQKYLHIQRQMAAEKRMNSETDPEIKEQMRRLIAQKVYNFDYLFGPAK